MKENQNSCKRHVLKLSVREVNISCQEISLNGDIRKSDNEIKVHSKINILPGVLHRTLNTQDISRYFYQMVKRKILKMS